MGMRDMVFLAPLKCPQLALEAAPANLGKPAREIGEIGERVRCSNPSEVL